MGADTFAVRVTAKNAEEAFAKARHKALHEFGHGGYTGTIAEKTEFTEIQIPEGQHKTYEEKLKFIDDLIEKADPRIDDKWGPAGCVDLGDGKWYFFGWASC